jgi:hypothetical protein
MKRALVALFLLGLGLPVRILGQPVSVNIASLLTDPARYDGQEVSIEAEAIGDRLHANHGTWVNFLDTTAAIGCFFPTRLGQDIRLLGGYKFKGDAFRVTGVFHATCPEHGGELDIHANRLELLQKGRPTSHPISQAKVALAAGLSLASALLGFKMSRRRAKGA